MSALGPDPAHARFSGQGKQTLQCAILFLDLVGYSARSVDEQVLVKKRLNQVLMRILRSVAPEQRLAIDTGDGAAVCFLGHCPAALQSALLLRDLLMQRYGYALSLRIGLHYGPVRVVPDINGRLSVVGDGINDAQRIMDFARPNQILLSRAYRDVLADTPLPQGCAFQEAGLHQDKHGRMHALYRVQDVALLAAEPAARYGADPAPQDPIKPGSDPPRQ